MHSARLDVSEGEPLGKEQSVFNVVATSGVSHRRKKITIFQSHWVRQRVFSSKRARTEQQHKVHKGVTLLLWYVR